MAIKKKYLKILQEINASIPKELLDDLMKKEKETPTIIKVVDKALADPDFPAEKKRKLQNIKDAGFLDKEVEVEDTKKLKKIEKYVEKEIDRHIRLGNLPEDRSLLLTKSRKYVRKHQKPA